MERVDRRGRATDQEYDPGPVIMYLDDLEALYERIRQVFLDDCSLFVDVDGLEPKSHTVFTHRVASFTELREVLGQRLRRGFLVISGDGNFRMDFHPILGVRVWADGEKGLQAFSIAEEVLRSKRRWFAPFLALPAWKYIALFAILQTTVMILRATPTTIGILSVAALWCFVILFQPEWSAGGLSKLSLIRRHEHTFLDNLRWKILAPLFVGVILVVLRACAPGIL